MLWLRRRLSRGRRAAGGARAVLRPGQLDQRDRVARDPVWARLPGRAVDARHARRAQPGADAARAGDGGDPRGARRAAVLAALAGRGGEGRRGRGRGVRGRAGVGADPARGGARVNATRIVRTALEAAPGALVVSSLGTATSALRAASD